MVRADRWRGPIARTGGNDPPLFTSILGTVHHYWLLVWERSATLYYCFGNAPPLFITGNGPPLLATSLGTVRHYLLLFWEWSATIYHYFGNGPLLFTIILGMVRNYLPLF